MAACVVDNTITKITERLSSLRIFGNKAITITENIKRHLLDIKGVQEHDVAATPTPEWLNEVTDAITDLWDLLDDQDLPKQSMITSFSSLFNYTPNRRSLLLRLAGIERRLEQIAADSIKLLPRNSKQLTDSSDVKDREIKIVGREAEKEVVVGQVLALTKVQSAARVVTILGMQGMGKTTFAKYVCCDDKVKSNFDLVIWIEGIHDDSYAESIVDHVKLESKKKKLEETGSRFLLVLDGFRSENRKEWLKLRQKLTTEVASSSGAAVLVITQDSLIANEVIGSRYCLLERLNEKDSRTLFEQIAGGEGPNESKIRDAQMEMVQKCRGVPVAIVTMARIMLKFHEANTESNIELWEEEFMQEMKLIYYNGLPSWHLKQCFAYLSMLFPSEEYRLKGEKIIRRFVAEGFLGPMDMNSIFSSPEQLQPEYLGLDCIREFRRRSILDVSVYLDLGYSINCSMYSELMLDLSRFVAGKERFCFCMDDRDETVKQTFNRVSLTRDFDVSNGIPKSLNKDNKDLRTILFSSPYNYGWSSRIPYEVKLSWSACDAILRAFNSLRVLELTDLGMTILPISIGKLKTLRYLDLSLNNMKKLPNSIGKLKHLQTLVLSHCHQLRELPNRVKHLVSLRHLDIEGCLHLRHMPSALQKMTNLQTLSHFVVSNSHEHIGGIGELINLNDLRGKLKISHLERLKFKGSEQGGHAYLKEKQHLTSLHLQWDHDDEDRDGDNKNDKTSLEHLEPHANLRGLRIKGYRGAGFSDWLLSLKNLVELVLYNCSMCKTLPPLDQFPKLEALKLTRLDSLEYITEREDGCGELVLGDLKTLKISDCPKLTSWWKEKTDNNARFGSIKELRIEYCPKLDSMPLFPDLHFSLTLERSSVKPLLETINYSSAGNSKTQSSDSDTTWNSFPPLYKVINLEIKKVEEKSPLPQDWLRNFISLNYLQISEKMSLMSGFKHLSSLKVMFITNCTGVDLPSDEWEGLQSLQSLVIEEVIELKSLPEGIKHLTSLNKLRIEGCAELTSLTEVICHLTSLKSLKIIECHKLASLPKGMSKLTSLNELIIRNCPLLLPRCQKETGDDWPQIKHIKDICLAGTSEVYE